jgi:hypothetical protein
VTVKTPAPERAAGRRKLAKAGKALPDDSYPIPNRSYLKKAIQAVGRAAPGKRPALGRLIRKRARELGAWSTVKGSWADNTQTAKAMSSALRATLELAAAQGEFVWELSDQPVAGEMDRVYKRAVSMAKNQGKTGDAVTKFAMSACKRYAANKGYPPSAVKAPAEYAGGREAIEFTGPKGYSHGWIYHGGPGLPKIAAGSKVRFPQSSGVHEGTVLSKDGEHLNVAVTKGAKSGQTIRIHAGMVSHYQHGTKGGGTKTPSKTGAEHSATDTAAAAAKYAPSGQKVTPAHSRSNEDRLKLIAHLSDVHGITHGHEGRSHQLLIEDHAADHESVISQRRGLSNHGIESRKHRASTLSTLQTNDLLDRKARGEDTSEPVGVGGMTLTQLQGNPQYKALRASGMSHGGALDRMAATKQTTQKPVVNAPKQPAATTKTPGGNTATVKTPGATTPTPVGTPEHATLLKARTAARAQYPQGHPERLKAERAVRQSRKTRRAGEGGSGGVTRTGAAPGTSRRRTSRTATPEGKTSAPSTGKSISDHQAEYAALKPHQKRAYDKAKLQGIGHERSMSVARGAAVPPKGTAGRTVRKAENKAAKASGATSKHPTLQQTLFKNRGANAIASEKQQAKDAALAERLGITVSKVGQLRTLAAALEARGWSQGEARKIALARLLHGTAIPQFAPGKKITRKAT